jgi:TolA-binding protein
LAQAPPPKLELTEDQRKAEEAFSLADGLYRKGFYDRALDKLLEFVKTYPQHANAPLAMLDAGECQYAQAKYAEAIPLYSRVLAEYPKGDEMAAAAYRIGQCKFSLRDYPGAVEAFRNLLAQAPDTQYKGAALYWIGEALFHQNQLPEAIQSYSQCRAVAPKGQYAAYAVYSIGVSQLRLNKPPEAMASFRTVLAEYADSPVAGESEVRLAEALYAGGQTADAQKSFESVIQRGQKDLLPRALHGLAWCLFDAKQWPKARATFERLVKDYPNDPLALAARRRIADCLYYEGKFAEAAKAYEAALADAPKDQAPDILFWQAAAYDKAGNRDAASAAYRRLTTDYAGSAPAAKASLRLADALVEKKDFDGAEKAYQAATASPDPQLKAEGELGLAWVAYQRGDVPGALARYERLGRAAPSSATGAQALLQGAKIALTAKNHSKACELARLFLQQNADSPDAPEGHYLLGLALAGADDKPGAVKELDQAAQAPKADFAADALARLAQLCRQLGDNTRADGYLARLKRDFPESGAGTEAQYQAAGELLKAGKYAEARRAYEAALATAKDNGVAAYCQLGIGATHYQEAHFEPALAAYKAVIDKYPQSEAAEAAALQAAVCLSRLAKYQEAVAALATFVAQHAASDLLPQANAELGWAYYKAGDKDKAKAIYEKALASAGASSDLAAEALFRLGEMAYEGGDYPGALTRYTELATKYPHSDLVAAAQYKRGWSLTQLKKIDEATEAFRQCLAAKPEADVAADCHYHIALALASQGQTEQALVELASFRTEYRASPVAPLALVTLAELLAGKSDWPGAEAAAKVAPDTGPNALRARRALVIGQALRAQKKLEEATKLLTEAADLGEGATAAAARFELASVQAEAGKPTQAADSFLNVAIVFPDTPFAPRALYEAGQCFERAGAKEDARKAYSSLVKDCPQATEWVQKAKARLEAMGG